MMAILIPGSFSFLTVPIAMRDLSFARASFPPAAAKCLLMISAAVGACGLSAVTVLIAEPSNKRRIRQQRKYFIILYLARRQNTTAASLIKIPDGVKTLVLDFPNE